MSLPHADPSGNCSVSLVIYVSVSPCPPWSPHGQLGEIFDWLSVRTHGRYCMSPNKGSVLTWTIWFHLGQVVFWRRDSWKIHRLTMKRFYWHEVDRNYMCGFQWRRLRELLSPTNILYCVFVYVQNMILIYRSEKQLNVTWFWHISYIIILLLLIN